MATGRLIGGLCVAAPVPTALVAVGANVLAQVPSEAVEGKSLAQANGSALGVALHGAVALGTVLVVAAGMASARRPELSAGPALTASLVLFFAYLAGMFALL